MAPVKRKESRSGVRKVHTLSAEQLERKRANDREAQRIIRQRTKEHIEQLETQVKELKDKGERYDDVIQRIAQLESENAQLRQQLNLLSGSQGYLDYETQRARPSDITSPSVSYQSAFSESYMANSLRKPPPALSVSSGAASLVPEWQSYPSTRSPSISTPDGPDPCYAPSVESYITEGQHPHCAPRAETAPAQIGANQLPFHAPGQLTGTPFQPMLPLYQPSNAHPGPGGDVQTNHSQPNPRYNATQRPIAAGHSVPVLQDASQFTSHQQIGQLQRNHQYPSSSPWSSHHS